MVPKQDNMSHCACFLRPDGPQRPICLKINAVLWPNGPMTMQACSHSPIFLLMLFEHLISDPGGHTRESDGQRVRRGLRVLSGQGRGLSFLVLQSFWSLSGSMDPD